MQRLFADYWFLDANLPVRFTLSMFYSSVVEQLPKIYKYARTQVSMLDSIKGKANKKAYFKQILSICLVFPCKPLF